MRWLENIFSIPLYSIQSHYLGTLRRNPTKSWEIYFGLSACVFTRTYSHARATRKQTNKLSRTTSSTNVQLVYLGVQQVFISINYLSINNSQKHIHTHTVQIHTTYTHTYTHTSWLDSGLCIVWVDFFRRSFALLVISEYVYVCVCMVVCVNLCVWLKGPNLLDH